MNATATRKPATKPVRKLSVVKPHGAGYLLLCITEGKAIDHYRVTPKSSDWGRAFRFEKFDDDHTTHDVLLSEDGHDVCCCKGFEFRGKCRHISAARKLVELQQV